MATQKPTVFFIEKDDNGEHVLIRQQSDLGTLDEAVIALRTQQKSGLPFDRQEAKVDAILAEGPDGTTEALGTCEQWVELFIACQERWGDNWNLEKLKVAVQESDVE